jgi:hypothetical protein
MRTLDRLEWYQAHGYANKLLLPKALDVSLAPFPPSTVSEAVANEYTATAYDAAKNTLEASWSEFCSKNVTENIPLTFESTYRVTLTSYGTGGSYNLPNLIVLNIAKHKADAATVLHEMVHLSIEPLIQKHAIAQADKERLVDLLVQKLFPAYASEQKRFADNQRVNTAFQELYPDISKIAEILAN